MNQWIRGIIYFCVSVGIIVLDRIAKIKALVLCQKPCFINDFLSFDIVFNRGISWGFFHSDSFIMFAAVSCIISAITGVVVLMGVKRFAMGKNILGEVLIVSGSLGNLLDRWYYQGVIDFILLSYKGYSWPVFNLADVSIVCGVIVIMIVYWKT